MLLAQLQRRDDGRRKTCITTSNSAWMGWWSLKSQVRCTCSNWFSKMGPAFGRESDRMWWRLSAGPSSSPTSSWRMAVSLVVCGSRLSASLTNDKPTKLTMLRITVHDKHELMTFQVEGTLVGPWVNEAAACWRRLVIGRLGKSVRFDLAGVTSIDAAGKEFLATMHAEGAQIIANGCLMRAIVAEITGHPVSDCSADNNGIHTRVIGCTEQKGAPPRSPQNLEEPEWQRGN